MKKVLIIIMGLLCAVSAGAAKYGTLYRDPRRGFIYTISSSHSTASSAGLAPAPVAAMGSVSRGAGLSRSRGVSSTMGSISVAMPVAVAPMSGIRTAAATVSGGVTTYDKAPLRPRGGIRKSGEGGGTGGMDDLPEGLPNCGCHWIDNGDGTYTCSMCNTTLDEFDIETGAHCNCVEESGYCWCPLDMNWGAMLFLALLAGGYAMWKKNRHTMPDNGRCLMAEEDGG